MRPSTSPCSLSSCPSAFQGIHKTGQRIPLPPPRTIVAAIMAQKPRHTPALIITRIRTRPRWWWWLPTITTTITTIIIIIRAVVMKEVKNTKSPPLLSQRAAQQPRRRSCLVYPREDPRLGSIRGRWSPMTCTRTSTPPRPSQQWTYSPRASSGNQRCLKPRLTRSLPVHERGAAHATTLPSPGSSPTRRCCRSSGSSCQRPARNS